MMSTSRRAPLTSASSTIRARRGSRGRMAILRPYAVSRLRGSLRSEPRSAGGSMAWSSSKSLIPSAIWRESGGSRKGKRAMSPSPRDVICRITEARLVRRISGSVNSGRASKSSCEYSRMQIPSATRPQRPARWLALAREMGSIGRRCTLVRWLYREMRAVPASTTYRMPGTVREVSATFVARTTRRPVCWPKTRCCSAADRRA